MDRTLSRWSRARWSAAAVGLVFGLSGGPALIDHLESVDLDVDADRAKPFRFPVQWVNRPNLDFRGFSGQIAAFAQRIENSIDEVSNSVNATFGARVAAQHDVAKSQSTDETRWITTLTSTIETPTIIIRLEQTCTTPQPMK